MDWTNWDAVLFDLDGVLTPTAEVHRRAWRELFTAALPAGAAPYVEDDYFAHIDGRPRYDGVREMLASRGVTVSEDTVRELGDRKNDLFTEILERDGVTAYPGSVQLLDHLATLPIELAVVSSSRNARPVLSAAGLLDRFEVIVDGVVAAEHDLPGKPAPDTFSHAARTFGVPDARAVVVEDATSGVAAGRAGAFGLVIGVDRGVGHAALEAAGADLVVDDLAELVAGS